MYLPGTSYEQLQKDNYSLGLLQVDEMGAALLGDVAVWLDRLRGRRESLLKLANESVGAARC